MTNAGYAELKYRTRGEKYVNLAMFAILICSVSLLKVHEAPKKAGGKH